MKTINFSLNKNKEKSIKEKLELCNKLAISIEVIDNCLSRIGKDLYNLVFYYSEGHAQKTIYKLINGECSLSRMVNTNFCDIEKDLDSDIETFLSVIERHKITIIK